MAGVVIKYEVKNLAAVEELRKAVKARVFLESTWEVEIPSIDRLDDAPGMRKGLGKALREWGTVAEAVDCTIVNHEKLKAAATIAKALRTIAENIPRARDTPASRDAFAALDAAVKKMRDADRPIPRADRLRVSEIADRIAAFTKCGYKHGVRRPGLVRHRANIIYNEVTNFQASSMDLRRRAA